MHINRLAYLPIAHIDSCPFITTRNGVMSGAGVWFSCLPHVSGCSESQVRCAHGGLEHVYKDRGAVVHDTSQWASMKWEKQRYG